MMKDFYVVKNVGSFYYTTGLNVDESTIDVCKIDTKLSFNNLINGLTFLQFNVDEPFIYISDGNATIENSNEVKKALGFVCESLNVSYIELEDWYNNLPDTHPEKMKVIDVDYAMIKLELMLKHTNDEHLTQMLKKASFAKGFRGVFLRGLYNMFKN